MKILLSGIDDFFEYEIKRKFNRLEYKNIQYLKEFNLERCNELIKNKKIDLMILGMHQNEDSEDYTKYLKFARENPKTPSLFIVSNSDNALMNYEANTHPPNLMIYLSELGGIEKDTMDLILKGNNLTCCT